MLRFLSSLNPRLPRAVQLLQLGGLMNAFGNGLVLPFLLIYLHNEQGIGLGIAGLILATNAGVSLIAGPIAGALVDRVGGKAMLTAALGFLALGFAAYAFVESPWQGFVASAVTGIGNGAFWPAQSTLLTGLTTRAQRPATFAMQRVVMNLGIGLGGVAGGFIATESFRALFLLDALTFVAYAAVLTVLVHEPVRREIRAARSGSYRTVLRHGVFMGLMVVNALYIGAGIAQLEILPAFAKNEAGVSEASDRLALLHQHDRRGAAAAAGDPPRRGNGDACRSSRSWASSRRPRGCSCRPAACGSTGTWAFVLLAAAVAVFALGQCLHGAVQPALVVDLADPRLIGRYMAISALSWQVGFTIGPAAGGVLLAASPAGLWVVMAAVLVLAGFATLALERGLPDELRRAPRGARAEEPVPLPILPAEQETSRVAG